MDYGKRIKNFRTKNNLTIHDLAEMTGVSTALLSQLERGLGNPTISVLRTIADAMKITVSNLLEEKIDNKEMIMRKNERKLVVHDKERWEVYTILSEKVIDGTIDVKLVNLMPGSQNGENYNYHIIEEVLIVQEGEVEIIFENEEFVLYQGDSIRILSGRKHMLRNKSDKNAIVISIKAK